MAAQTRALSVVELARATGVTESELRRALRQNDDVRMAAAGIAAPAERVTFTAEDVHGTAASNPNAVPKGIDAALISLAARPGVLDGEIPKCLLKLGKQPVIGHVLDQLFAGGVKRIVFVLGARGDLMYFRRT